MGKHGSLNRPGNASTTKTRVPRDAATATTSGSTATSDFDAATTTTVGAADVAAATADATAVGAKEGTNASTTRCYAGSNGSAT